MTYTISPDKINPGLLAQLFLKVADIVVHKGGVLAVTDLLAILRLPEEAAARIRKARGNITVTLKADGTCKAQNNGDKVEEDLPGTLGAIGIVIQRNLSCEFRFSSERELVIDSITGLEASLLGFFNPGVDKITIRLPRHVELEV